MNIGFQHGVPWFDFSKSISVHQDGRNMHYHAEHIAVGMWLWVLSLRGSQLVAACGQAQSIGYNLACSIGERRPRNAISGFESSLKRGSNC